MAHRPVPTKAIPWQFSTYGDYVQYEWEHLGTDAHSTFRAQVVSQAGQWSWSLEAGAAANPLWRISGQGPDKATCEDLVCEAIAKAFFASGPYRDLVDAAGRRYTIAGGSRLDLADVEDRRVRITLTDGTRLDGTLRTGGWNLRLVDTGRTFSITPTVVVAVDEL